ncbi:MAG: hypothetical protein J7L82_03445 [Staphylothermus sp.]|nr:hypothetical protein [Staphylothermus sp.]
MKEKMSITKKVLIAFLIIVIIMYTSPAMSALKRNDEYIPSELARIDNNYLIEKLNELKKLNDTVINNYVEQITNMLENVEYDKAYELLKILNQYIQENYGEDVANTGLAQTISLLQSLTSISDQGIYVNLTKYLETLSKILNDPELLKYIEELRSGEIPDTKYLQDLMTYINELEVTTQTTKTKVLETSEVEDTMIENISIFNPSLPPLPQDKFGNVFSLPQITMPSLIIDVNTLISIVLVVTIFTMVYYYRNRLATLFTPLRKRILYGINQVRTTLKYGKQDLVIELYIKWYNLVKAMGYERKSYETLREFLVRITDKSLVDKGRIVTELYEKRIYGETMIDEELIDRVKNELKELISFKAMKL